MQSIIDEILLFLQFMAHSIIGKPLHWFLDFIRTIDALFGATIDWDQYTARTSQDS